jgi:2-desacetyl-2-hydroxyethyl bacteriochlorophyllide A dehydrogenase
MKSVRLIEPGKPLELREVDIPETGDMDVLVQVKAAGICHSDAHYRAGKSRVHPLPLTLGHEVAGVIEKVGSPVTDFAPGDRVALHYMVTCGECRYCRGGHEQFCTTGKMIGKYRDGGYAEKIVVPERSVFHLPDEIPFEQGAIMMCSTATAYHSLRKARLKPGERVAVFGAGGLGISAVQLARIMGAAEVYAVDIKENKLALAQRFGAIPVNASWTDPVAEIRRLTQNEGVEVAVELIGLLETMEQAFRSLGAMGRLAIAGIGEEGFEFSPYMDLINREAEIIGVSDHLASELEQLLEWVQSGRLDLSQVVTGLVPLDADEINQVLDRLEGFSEDVRVVITPDSEE